MVLATIVFWLRKRRRFSLWAFADYVALITPIGLFFGRLANFINYQRLDNNMRCIPLVNQTFDELNRHHERNTYKEFAFSMVHFDAYK